MASRKRETKAAGKADPDSEANARAREAALGKWVAAIAEGATQRGAAVPIFKEHGFTYKQLLGWCQRDPEGWGALLDAATDTKVERMEAVVRRVAMAGPDDITEDPQSAKVRAWAATWLLSKWRRQDYGDKVTNEHTGKDGGPIETKATVERYTLSVPKNGLLKDGGE